MAKQLRRDECNLELYLNVYDQNDVDPTLKFYRILQHLS